MAVGLMTRRFARATGVSAQIIRYYEQVGVLPPPSRTAAGYRQYTERAVDRLLFLRRARALRPPLLQLRKLVQPVDEGSSASFRPRLRELDRIHLSIVQQRIAKLEFLRRELEHILDRLMTHDTANQPNAGRRSLRRTNCSCLETIGRVLSR
jgi:MerR family copper efflux transcriptional regulator